MSKYRERAAALVAKMTLEEKVSQTLYNAPAIERLGISAYNWWNEALHGVARAGTATVFPQAIGVAASFDEELVGLAVRDAETGEALGKLEEVLSYPAHKIYVVRGGRDEFLIPAVPAFIAGIDMAGGTVDVYMMEGLGIHEN